MRVKLNRYEFAVKEAVLFLAKPMENYDVWLTGKDIRRDSLKQNVQEANRIRTQSAMPASSPMKTEKFRDASAPTPAQLASKQHIQTQNLYSENTANPTESAAVFLQNDITVMECVRLSLNYLKNAQLFVKTLPVPDKISRSELKDIGQLPVKDEFCQTDAPYTSNERIQPQEASTPVQVTTEILLEARTVRINKNLAIIAAIEKKKLETVHDEEEEGDLASADFNVAKFASPEKPDKCGICRNFMLQLDHQRDAYDAIVRERDCLEDFLHEERSARDRIQQSKDILDAELEELTAQLFEQANKMVVEEAILRDALEIKNKDLKEGMSELSTKIQNREEELIVLRRHINTLEKTRTMTKSGSPHASITNISKISKCVHVDGVLFQEFQDFLQKINSTQFITAAVLSTIPFVKRCTIEDIEPCLFYSYFYPGSTLKVQPLPAAMRKRVLEGVMNLQCEFVKDENMQKKVKLRCGLCNIVRDCDYKISLSTIGKQIWTDCCKFCQVRLSVCQDFYKFIGFFKSTKQQSTLLGLYRQIAMFRGAIVLAREGSHSFFDLEMVHASFIGTEWEKNVLIQN